jgi:hypothetical protein
LTTVKENIMKKNFLRICVALLALTLVACLDDDKYALDPSGSENIIEFYDPSVPSSPAGAIYPVWTATTPVQAEFTVEQVISYSGPNNNSKDIDLVLGIDPVALEEYNDQMKNELHGSTYNLMPDTYYDFTATEVTISNGEKQVTISAKFYPDQFDLSKNWALPLRIVSASDGILSAHFSVAILAVVVKNDYDGIYTIEDGNIFRNLGGTPDLVLGGDYGDGLEMDWVTVNGNTNLIVPEWKDGSTIGGVAPVRVAVNEGVTNPDGTHPITLTGAPATWTMFGTNKYDPATRTFVINVTWGVPPNERTLTNLTVTWDRERP